MCGASNGIKQRTLERANDESELMSRELVLAGWALLGVVVGAVITNLAIFIAVKLWDKWK